ncbi:MAG: hypothetical protein A2Y12_06370 [Planctomycetes bacterium GWF2_42_9]|nr:MAG: hypothetical protein A2Y12_06370 [Planctomycetes bacterium GWF2_42_9]
MDHSKITRLLKLLTALSSGQFYTIDKLSKLFCVAKRTIFRDLKLLREIGIPYLYDRKKQCPKIEPNFFLSPPNLTKDEAFALFLLVKMSKNTVSPFNDVLTKAAVKIYNNLSEDIKQYCRQTLEDITISSDYQIIKDRHDEWFMKLIDAITNKRIIHIQYYMSNSMKAVELEPYHIRCYNNQWFVIGKSRHNNSLVSFDFRQIREIKLQNKCFFIDEEFDIDEYLDNKWAMQPQARLYDVKLKFAPELAQEITAKQWHHTQAISYQPDGSVIIKFQIDSLNEIKWWILSYADKVQVLEPPILREKIVAIVNNVIKQ